MPENINRYKKICKDWIRGYSQTVQHESYQPDFLELFKCVVLIDNEFPAGEDNWNAIEIRSNGGIVLINAPLVACEYRSGYNFIDRWKQEGSYYHFHRKTVRKQNRILEDAIKTYAIVNARTVFINTPNIIEEKSKADLKNVPFRFEIVRVWFAKYSAMNGRSSTHYPLCQPLKRRIENTMHLFIL